MKGPGVHISSFVGTMDDECYKAAQAHPKHLETQVSPMSLVYREQNPKDRFSASVGKTSQEQVAVVWKSPKGPNTFKDLASRIHH